VGAETHQPLYDGFEPTTQSVMLLLFPTVNTCSFKSMIYV
jgi:hypothetical protein